MPEFSIESNGRIEKTAVYYNGEQIGGIKEVFLNLDEDGAFDAVIQYKGSDGEIYSKEIFNDYMTNMKVVEPSFTEEEAESLRLLSVASSGEIDTTVVALDGEEQNGITSLFVHIKSGEHTKSGLASLFKGKSIPEAPEFKAEITYRYANEVIETESVF